MTTESSIAQPSIRGSRRRALDTAAADLVRRDLVPGAGPMPLVITPAAPGVDLEAWVGAHPDTVEELLIEHGAILFRGFGLTEPPQFEAVAMAVCPNLYGEYGDLPKEETGQRIYHSTPYPEDMSILFHNESSHLPSWPTRQFFFCVQPSPEGGNTPLLDCEAVMHHLDPELVERMDSKKLCYVRNFIPGVDVSWHDFFKTEDRAEVEWQCESEGMTCEWHGDLLRVKNYTEAIRVHPQRHTKLFFNQVQLHHSSCLDPRTRTALLEICGDEWSLPRNVFYGDDSPISDDEMAHINEVFFAQCVQLPWERGDIIAVDNMRVSHARLPFKGPRKITVAMGAMMHGGPIERHATN